MLNDEILMIITSSNSWETRVNLLWACLLAQPRSYMAVGFHQVAGSHLTPYYYDEHAATAHGRA